MKQKWLCLVWFFCAIFSASAAEVSPRIVPSAYNRTVGVDFYSSIDPIYSITSQEWFAYTFPNELGYWYESWCPGVEEYAYMTLTWPPSEWPVTTLGSGEVWFWVSNNLVDIWSLSNQTTWFEIANEYVDIFASIDYIEENGPGSGMRWTNANTQLTLWTGGTTNVAKTNFFRLSAWAYDVATTNPISPTALTVAGKRCDTNGAVYLSLPDNIWTDCTPLPDWQQTYAHYTFGVTSSKAKLRLFWGDTDITDSDIMLYVGEGLTLTCRFDNQSVATITNFSWSIPGQRVANYVQSSTAGIVDTNVVLTNSSATFYWYRPGTNLVVQCTVQVMGQTLSAKATFQVQAPTANLNAQIFSPVGLSSAGGGNAILHFGIPTGPVGIQFRGTNMEPDAIATNGAWFFLQIVSTVQSYNLSNGINITYATNGVDTLVPYPLLETINTPGLSRMTEDSPNNSLESTTVKCWRNDSFVMYLFFQSNRGTSIPVPIKQTDWFWGGVCTNVGGTWASGSLLSSTNGIGASNISSTTLPEWNHNIANYRYTTNAYWNP
jgi:hypothetical protein